MLTYFDSAEGIVITRKQAMRVLAKHYVDAIDLAHFDAEMGVRDEYDAQDVLRWLGY